MWKARISIPSAVAMGDVVEVKTLVAHPMESGFRRNHVGEPVPRDILTEFRCTYAGRDVIRVELFPAFAANPFLSFFIRADRSGETASGRYQHHEQVAGGARPGLSDGIRRDGDSPEPETGPMLGASPEIARGVPRAGQRVAAAPSC